ncbi:unnamed protein product, partial [Chrysoparadoxa australica]
AAFVSYVKEQKATLATLDLEQGLRRHLLACRDAKGLDLRASFAAFDKSSTGVISQGELKTALLELGFTSSAEDMSNLGRRLDP